MSSWKHGFGVFKEGAQIVGLHVACSVASTLQVQSLQPGCLASVASSHP